jgi:spore germination protein KB
MNYNPGKMGVAEGTSLILTTNFVIVFISIWSLGIEQATTSAWLIPFLTALAFGGMLMLLLSVMKHTPGDLLEITASLIGNWAARLFTVYFIITFYVYGILLLRQFSENTLITAIPTIDITMICTWFALIAVVVSYIGIEPIARAVYIIIPFLVVGIALILALLYDRFNIYNLTPWLGVDVSTLLVTGIKGVSIYHAFFLIPLLATSFQNRKTLYTVALLGIGLSTLIRTVILLAYIGIFGVAVGQEKILPFFELSRLIFVSRFIQRIETFFIIFWAIFGLAAIAISLYMTAYLLTRLFNLPSLRPLLLPLALVAVQLSLLPADIATTIEYSRLAQHFELFGVYAIPAILYIVKLLKGNEKSHVQ